MSIDGGESIHMSASADVATAEKWTRAIERSEAKRLGVSTKQARKTVARKLRTSPGTLENIRRLRTKLLPSWLRDRIRSEFISVLQSEIQRLEHEILIARQIGADAREDVLREAETQLASAREILEASR